MKKDTIRKRMNERLKLTVEFCFDSVSLLDYKPSLDWSNPYSDDAYWTAEELEVIPREQVEQVYPYELYERKAEEIFDELWYKKIVKQERRCLNA